MYIRPKQCELEADFSGLCHNKLHDKMAQRPGAKVRRGVAITSSVMLVLQIIAFMCTAAFYWFASSDGTRYYLSRAVFTALYHQNDWPYLKRQQALEVYYFETECSMHLESRPLEGVPCVLGRRRSRYLEGRHVSHSAK